MLSFIVHQHMFSLFTTRRRHHKKVNLPTRPLADWSTYADSKVDCYNRESLMTSEHVKCVLTVFINQNRSEVTADFVHCPVISVWKRSKCLIIFLNIIQSFAMLQTRLRTTQKYGKFLFLSYLPSNSDRSNQTYIRLV